MYTDILLILSLPSCASFIKWRFIYSTSFLCVSDIFPVNKDSLRTTTKDRIIQYDNKWLFPTTVKKKHTDLLAMLQCEILENTRSYVQMAVTVFQNRDMKPPSVKRRIRQEWTDVSPCRRLSFWFSNVHISFRRGCLASMIQNDKKSHTAYFFSWICCKI